MRYFAVLITAASIICAQTASQEAPAQTGQGIPARATPGDYQAQAKVGDITLAAEFTGHSAATPQGVFTTEDYVAVEVALFGAPDAKTRISSEDFSLHVNGKKNVLSSQPVVLLFRSLKDPEWEPPAPPPKSKSSIGGSGQEDNTPPIPPKMPMELQHVMQQKVQRAALAEGERTLPQAGLLFFVYHGKTQSIRSLELIYSGPAGKATLTLQP